MGVGLHREVRNKEILVTIILKWNRESSICHYYYYHLKVELNPPCISLSIWPITGFSIKLNSPAVSQPKSFFKLHKYLPEPWHIKTKLMLLKARRNYTTLYTASRFHNNISAFRNRYALNQRVFLFIQFLSATPISQANYIQSWSKPCRAKRLY